MTIESGVDGSVVALEPGRFRVCTDLSFDTVTSVLRELRTLLRGNKKAVEFDLAGVQRADSAGVALLIELMRMGREGQYELRFTHVPRQLEVLAAVAGVDGLLQ